MLKNREKLIQLVQQEKHVKTNTILPHSTVIASQIFELTQTSGYILLGVDTTKFKDGRVTFNKLIDMSGFRVDEILEKALERFSLPLDIVIESEIIDDKKIVIIRVGEDKTEKIKLLRLWVNMKSEYLENGIYGSKYVEYVGQMMMLEKLLIEFYDVEDFPSSFIKGLNITNTTCPTCKK